MFIPQQKIKKITKLAHQDVLFVIEALLTDPNNTRYWPGAGWLNALSAAKKIDQNFPASNSRSLSDFLEPFLDWLERRRVNRLRPWVYRNHQLELEGDSPCLWFLELFHFILGDLIEPGHAQKGMNGSHITDRLRASGILIAKRKLINKPWTLTFYPKPPNENLYGFASWLIVFCKGKELHIMYDRDQIVESGLKTEKVVERLEKTYLHELGHARSDLEFYLSELAKRPAVQLIRAAPIHETHAWLYAHTVRALLSSARSRVSRLLGEYDNEWR